MPSSATLLSEDTSLKRQESPQPIKKFNGYKRTTTSEESSYFGTHLGCYSFGNPRRSTNASSYSTMSDFDSWASDEPCSLSQTDDNLMPCREKDCLFSRTGERHFDTGYSSQSPDATRSLLDQFTVDCISSVNEIECRKLEATEKELSECESKKNGRFVMFKARVDRSAMEIINEDTIISTLTIPRTLQKATELNVENQQEVSPNYFIGKEYGYLLESLSASGTNAILEEFNRNPDKFFKRLDTTTWYRKRMPLLFGKSHKTPADVVKTLREVLIILDKLPPPRIDKDGNVQTDKKYDKALDEVSKNVAMIKSFIYGNDTTEPSSEHAVQVAQLAQEVYNANILPMLVKMLPKFEFECKKDVGQIFNNLLRRQIGTRSPTVEYLGARPEILIQLVQGYSVPDIALTCGLMLRESIRHDHLAKIILYSEVFNTFFSYVQSEVFDIASDAFSTFKELTTRHKSISAEFLDTNYDSFFAQYQNLLNSKNYVTRRQSLKLLGELLLDRHNFNIMTKYISNPENLKLMMELLRDKSRNIQYEAFHVFKVFVANPNKPKPISDILNRNREKLVEFLGDFHNDRTDDEQFNDEKAYLIKQIQEMKSSPKEPKKPKPKEDEELNTAPTPSPPLEGSSSSQAE